MNTELFHLIENLESEIAIPEDGIISRTIHQNEHVKAVLFGFAPGQELSEHTASMPGIMHFLSGNARVTVADHATDSQPGMWIYMNPNVPHSILAKDKCTMLLLLIKAAKTSISKGNNA